VNPLTEDTLLTVCTAPGWAARVAARSCSTLDDLLAAADAELTDADLDPAMAGHPRIGDRTAGGRSRHEQSAVAAASDDVLDALAAGNRAYEERFGHVYLVCATGRSAEDLLATLHTRLRNDAATERAVALVELAAINRIRLTQLVAGRAAPGVCEAPPLTSNVGGVTPHTSRRPA
jgi:2-oxo-4-hydroxy-4-carboxy-5-ureidoimidazoline decarboxylase